MADASVVITTHNALPWIEQCLESVAGVDTVVVDNASSDDTVAFVRERFPAVEVVEQENLGLAAGWARGLEEIPPSRWVLILNADAWLAGDALERMVAVGDAHPDAAVVAPKLLNPDGSLQRSVRGFPTRWRLATEYFYLRKLGRRTELLNGFYGAGFDHASEREVECVMGACMLVRRAAIDDVGPPDASFFLFSEEVDWCYRFAQAGWSTLLHARGAVRARRRRLARRAPLPRQPPRSSALLPQAPRRRRRPSASGRCCTGRSSCAAGSCPARRGRCTATRPAGSGRATFAR